MFDFSVRQIGIIIAVGPLLFQIVFMLVLAQASREVEDAIRKDLHSRAIIAQSNYFYQSAVNQCSVIFSALSAPSGVSDTLVSNSILQSKIQADKLRSLVNEDASQSRNVSEFLHYNDEIIRKTKYYLQAQKNIPISSPDVMLYIELQKSLKPAAEANKKIVQYEESQNLSSIVLEKRAFLHLALFSGLILELACCAMLATFCAQNCCSVEHSK